MALFPISIYVRDLEASLPLGRNCARLPPGQAPSPCLGGVRSLHPQHAQRGLGCGRRHPDKGKGRGDYRILHLYMPIKDSSPRRGKEARTGTCLRTPRYPAPPQRARILVQYEECSTFRVLTEIKWICAVVDLSWDRFDGRCFAHRYSGQKSIERANGVPTCDNSN
jgi:hypothetical protein